MPRRWWLGALSGALIVVALLACGVPWLTRDRAAMTATPTPPPFQKIAPIELEPGSRVCETLVAFEPATRAAIVRTARTVRQGPPLRLTARAPGYQATGTIAGGYGGLESLQAQLDAPPRSSIGDVCVENVGRRRVLLQGTIEGRIQNRSATIVDGQQIPAKMTLLLTEEHARSLSDRPGQILDRIAAFKPPVLGPAVLAIVGLLILVGVPAAVIYAVVRGIAEEE